jgi:UDP-glucuronate 4-epimerase
LYGIRFLALRLFTAYGPRQRPDLAIRKMAELILAGRPVPVYGDSSSSRDYTYVDDIVAGIRAGMDYRATAYEIVNLGSGRPIALRDMIRALEEALGAQATLEARPAQPGDVPHTYADIRKAQALLGYSPATPFAEGLAHFVEWMGSKVGPAGPPSRRGDAGRPEGRPT